MSSNRPARPKNPEPGKRNNKPGDDTIYPRANSWRQPGDENLSPRERAKVMDRRRKDDLRYREDRYGEPALARICGANIKSGTGICRFPAGDRTSHPGFGNCAQHGGNTPSGKKKAMKESVILLQQQQRVAVNRFGGDKNDPLLASLTPEEALLEEVRRSVAMVRFLESKISRWLPPDQQTYVSNSQTDDDDPHVWDDVKAYESARDLAGLPTMQFITFKGTPAETDHKIWLDMYRNERDHLVRVSKMAADMQLSERLVRLAERQADLLAATIQAVIDSLYLSPDQKRLVPYIVPKIFQQAAEGTAPKPVWMPDPATDPTAPSRSKKPPPVPEVPTPHLSLEEYLESDDYIVDAEIVDD